MLKKLLIVIAAVMPFHLLMAGNITYAADFGACAGAYCGLGGYNPRAANGLMAVTSSAFDHDYYVPYFDAWVSKRSGAAAYGSDSSIDGISNPRLLGYAVEPMADVTASVSVIFSNGTFTEASAALAFAEVNHRVIARAFPEILRPTLDALATVPVRLDYKLSATITNPVTGEGSWAEAGFTLSLDTDRILSKRACMYASGIAADPCATSELSGTLSTDLMRNTVDQTYLYTISVGADVNVATWGAMNSREGQAVADPFLYVDPTWEYAPYFTVQQESLLHPGEWIEVTREWQNTAVPLPAAAWLFGSGLLGLIGVARRRV